MAERYQTPYPKDARDKVRQARFLASKRQREQQQAQGGGVGMSANHPVHNCHLQGRQPHSWQQQQQRPRALGRKQEVRKLGAGVEGGGRKQGERLKARGTGNRGRGQETKEAPERKQEEQETGEGAGNGGSA